MIKTRKSYFIYLIPLFMSIFITLNLSPIIIQGQPTNLNQNCFPVESGAETLMCLDNTIASGAAANNSQDVTSSVSMQNQSAAHESNQNCFPVESGAETLMCLDNTIASGDAESSEDTN